jgi:hypothetical protein
MSSVDPTAAVTSLSGRVSSRKNGGNELSMGNLIVFSGFTFMVVGVAALAYYLYRRQRLLEAQIAFLDKQVKQQVGENDIVQIVAATMQQLEQQRFEAAREMYARQQQQQQNAPPKSSPEPVADGGVCDGGACDGGVCDAGACDAGVCPLPKSSIEEIETTTMTDSAADVDRTLDLLKEAVEIAAKTTGSESAESSAEGFAEGSAQAESTPQEAQPAA